jgi:hypothetical protein
LTGSEASASLPVDVSDAFSCERTDASMLQSQPTYVKLLVVCAICIGLVTLVGLFVNALVQ